MLIAALILSTLFSLFSTAVMSYISMAAGIGPWIAPTLVLINMMVFRLMRVAQGGESMVLASVSGSIGGILATGIGFSFPAVYFLDKARFEALMADPISFSVLLGCVSFAAGGLGYVAANLFENNLLVEQRLAFPIGQVIHKMVVAGNQIKKAYELAVGFVVTAVFCILQDGFFAISSMIPKSLLLFSGYKMGMLVLPAIRFDLFPMLWAIGFIAGHLIAIPLATGVLAKIFLVDPVHQLFFAQVNNAEYVFGFCAGMVLWGTLISFVGLPKLLKKIIAGAPSHKNPIFFLSKFEIGSILDLLIVAFGSIYLFYAGFSLPQQVFLFGATVLFVYQMMVIAGKMGIAPLGRFATFVMVPAMFMFNVDSLQIVLIATFVEIAGGVGADILFGRKAGQLAGISSNKIKMFQFFGLIVSCVAVGAIFWTLINYLELGSDVLFAYKAQNRQILIDALRNASTFNALILLVGAVFSYLLRFLKVNPILVLGGILMPLNLSLGLVFGGFLTLLVKKREDWEPFWSGIFASNSIWMILQSLIK